MSDVTDRLQDMIHAAEEPNFDFITRDTIKELLIECLDVITDLSPSGEATALINDQRNGQRG